MCAPSTPSAQEGSVQLSQKLSRANTALYRFTYRRNSVSSLNINPLLIPLYSQPVRIGILAGSFIQDRRDDPTDSHRGVFNTADFGVASRDLRIAVGLHALSRPESPRIIRSARNWCWRAR